MSDFEIIDAPMSKLTLSPPKPPPESPVQPNTSTVQVPRYDASTIQSNRSDGYWVEKFHFDVNHDRAPGIIA